MKHAEKPNNPSSPPHVQIPVTSHWTWSETRTPHCSLQSWQRLGLNHHVFHSALHPSLFSRHCGPLMFQQNTEFRSNLGPLHSLFPCLWCFSPRLLMALSFSLLKFQQRQCHLKRDFPDSPMWRINCPLGLALSHCLIFFSS